MSQLAWLPTHANLTSAIRTLRNDVDPQRRLRGAIELAGYDRDFVATEQIDRLMGRSRDELTEDAQISQQHNLNPTRLSILSSHTVDHLLPAIRIAGVTRRLEISVQVAPYGLYRQVLLGDDAELASFAPQFILLALDSHETALGLPLDASENAVAEAIDQRVEELRHLWRRAKERFTAQVIQQTLIPAAGSVFGSYDGMVPASPAAISDQFNARLRSAAKEEGVLLLDLAWQLRHQTDFAAIADLVRWYQAKQLISPHFAPLYGDLLARVIAAAKGLSRKCLVLDLDNTLWGGVIGDDGIDGIRLGQGDPEGEAFQAFQHYIALLAKRGVVLAVCSKNDSAIAEAAFADHPAMILRRADIGVFTANWEDKASNLRQIAQQLDLGADSFVFVDDNPAERDIIRRELPEVAVPELPDDIAGYPMRLSAAGYFESASFTSDDANRSRSYALQSERRAALAQATDLEGYLKGLTMVLTAKRIGPSELPRSAQLVNKSNQFNLTTRRYTEAELERLLKTDGTIGLCFRLKDRFGDNGLISVIIARPDTSWGQDHLLIDTWLMSCRVLGRQVEAAALEALGNEMAAHGVSSLIGEYRPTPRNKLVENHYLKLGFVPIPAPPDAIAGATFWRFDLTAMNKPMHSIKFEDGTLADGKLGEGL